MDSVIGRRSVTPSRARSLGLTPPPRDPMEDTDASVTRKRPRLDSGDRSYRSMSADPQHSSPSGKDLAQPLTTPPTVAVDSASSGAAHVTPSTTLAASKVTINVRDPPTTVDATSSSFPPKDTSAAIGVLGAPTPSSRENVDSSAVLSASSSPVHSPEIEVAEIEDMDGEPTETRWRPLGGADLLNAKRTQDGLLRNFPCWKNPHSIVSAVDELARHFERGKLVAPSLRWKLLKTADDVSASSAFERLASWIEAYLDNTESLSFYWFEMYLDRRDFWEEFPTMIRCLLNRK